MRNKWILTLIIAILALPILSTSVFAEETVVYEDGEYLITAKAINADTSERSGAAGFLNEEATLNIKDGEATLTITVPHNEMAEITGLQVEGDKPDVTEDETARYMAFKLANLKSELNAQVQYEVPSIGLEHDVPFKFVLEDLDEIPVVEEEPTEPEEEPTEPEQPVDPEEPSEPETIDLADGFYTINGSYLHLEEEKASTMTRYLDSSLFLEVVNGKVELTVTVNADETVTLLKVDGKNAIESKVDGKKRYDTYELDSLASIHHGYVDYQAPMKDGSIHYGKAKFRISLAEDSIAETDASAKPGYEEESEVPEEPTEPEEPSDGEDPADKEEDNNNKPEDKEDPVDKDNRDKTKPETPEKKDQLVPDKAYEIDFEIKHESEDKTSAADSFFKGPAILLEKDGERYLQITVTGKQYIESLKNKFGDMVVVKEDGNTIVYQFKLDGSISDVILLDMIITVPGIYEGQNHKARLFLNESSMKEIDASAYRLVASDNGNGPTVDGESGDGNQTPDPGNDKPKTDDDKTTPEKPELGSGDDNNQSGDQTENGEKAQNPQTGDSTNIMLYVILLIGSAIPLALKLKRRFV
ncbi:hypothetical protein CIL05_09560 [Virgibacillus profundi]|uniref:NEAT domain-containing protein n=1 Tax=Virgibacillus profundi TaxID=2024555 RepID=A0A2A2IEV3_9BACI|nr:NEAT domain-containing protein [Virgibacillus profundi]PAV29613.1 hypothetical protein CIL05_09560 [Virgibacillus profundi]PXY53785.1 sortase B protein-sorting domain-containing protein [Virgibacillus profundi]